MINRIIELARTEDKSNHQIAIGFYKARLFQVEDLISTCVKIMKSDKEMKCLKLFGKLSFKKLSKSIYMSYDSRFYSEYSHLTVNKKIESKHIEFVKDLLDRILFPNLFLSHQKVCELVFRIKRTDKKALKFPLEKSVLQKIRRLLIKSNYKSLLFLLGLDFLKNLYRYYQDVKWFDECAKIEDDIAYTNNYFKLKNKIEL